MAKARPRRRSSSQFLHLQRLATRDQIAGPCAALYVARTFPPSQSNWAARVRRVNPSVAKTSDGYRVCTCSKHGVFQHSRRQPERNHDRNTPLVRTVTRPGRRRPESRASK
jgi:hypothetical protein